ncbi:DUF1330 domain-containing protein [Sphingomonas sp. CGMCC 1.13654]|uniref:DUF1330 domain-containing protein n=1 Tax=Sphingomonas chungangi TaxID=2683589 RepID=A0A838L3T4_9SPHN|nr:DUF1330 domain-containing protein [Sphingomonas chungangi]MBA2933580.1 DUF1330 domain-containing protein [Sphingomonas chungangi]MVW54913.1 DUF1330 domain-containing protein [Sphingomonas chungangi]
MADEAVFVVVEVLSVEDPAGFQRYVREASALIGARGGELVGRGSKPVDDEPGFGPLVIQRWRSEIALRAWFESDAYQPLNALRQASAKMRVTIVPSLAVSGS